MRLRLLALAALSLLSVAARADRTSLPMTKGALEAESVFVARCAKEFVPRPWEGGASWLAGYGVDAAERAEAEREMGRGDGSLARRVCAARWRASHDWRRSGRDGAAWVCSPGRGLAQLVAAHGERWILDGVERDGATTDEGGGFVYYMGLAWGHRVLAGIGGAACEDLTALPPYKWDYPSPRDICRAELHRVRGLQAARRGASSTRECEGMIASIERFEPFAKDRVRVCALLHEAWKSRSPALSDRLLSSGALARPKIYGWNEDPEHLLDAFFALEPARCGVIAEASKRRQCLGQARFASAAGDPAAARAEAAEQDVTATRWLCALLRVEAP